MPNLKRVHDELFRRAPDERYDSLAALLAQCRQDREASHEHWIPPPAIEPRVTDLGVRVRLGTDGAYALFMTENTLAEPATDGLDAKIASAAGKAQNKSKSTMPVVHETLYPVNVSYFPKAVTKQDGETFIAHDFSISVAHLSKEGEADWTSLSIKRRDAHKLLTALQAVYQASYKHKPENPAT